MTYPQWRTQTRVLHAMIQLAEGASVTEAAHRCGFATTSAFIDTFTRTMGQTPGQYRRGSATQPPRGSRPHQPGLVGEHHGLGPVTQPQLAEDPAQVALDRGLADEQDRGDFAVG